MSVVANLIVECVLAAGPWISGTIETDASNVVDVAYSNDGTAIFCVLDDATIRKLDIESGLPVWSHQREYRCTEVAVGPSENLIATAGYGDVIEIRDGETGEVINSIDTPRFYLHLVQELQFVEGGNAMIAASAPGRIVHANLETEETRRIGVTFGERDWPRTVEAYTVSDNLKLVAAATRCGVTRFVSFGEAEPIKPIGDAQGFGMHVPITAAAFAPDGTMLAIGMDHAWGHYELIFRNIDGTSVGEAARVRIPYRVNDVFYTESPDEIVVVSSNRVSLWNLVEQSETGTVLLEEPSFRSAAYCPLRRELAVGMRDGTIARIGLGSHD